MKAARAWKEVKQRVYTEEQIRALDAKFEFISAIVEARIKKQITQKKLEQMTGISQPVIARLENGRTSAQLDTILKILGALGKTIKVVDISEKQAHIGAQTR